MYVQNFMSSDNWQDVSVDSVDDDVGVLDW
jgi:hypothetical protein